LTGVFDAFLENQNLTPVYPRKNMAGCGHVIALKTLIGTGFAGYEPSDETHTKL